MTNQEQNYKITAIIKTYNCEDTLCDALESLRDLDEIIIIDEHSNDDTVEIAKEYKAKVIYADKNDLSIAINQAINEAQGEWIFVVEQDEIIPQRLILDLHNYVENPKKNRYCVSLAQKVFYLNKEIKAARSKNNLRFFKKGYAEFKNDNSFELKIKQGKLFKLNKIYKKQNLCLLKYIKKDMVRIFEDIFELNRNKIKTSKNKKASVVFKPCLKFVKWFIFKRAFLDGKYVFIYSKIKYFEEFTFQNMILEKILKGKENDF